jgi:hypothetical protein
MLQFVQLLDDIKAIHDRCRLNHNALLPVLSVSNYAEVPTYALLCAAAIEGHPRRVVPALCNACLTFLDMLDMWNLCMLHRLVCSCHRTSPPACDANPLATLA